MKNEKQKWLELACSENEASRKLAFDLAASMKDEIQGELIIWMHILDDWEQKFTLYQLLSAESKQLLKQKEVDEQYKKISNFKDYEMFSYTDNPDLKKVILNFVVMSFNSSDKLVPFCENPRLIAFVKDYRIITGCSLSEARDVVVEFRDRYLGIEET